MMSHFDAAQQQAVLGNVFISGGNSLYPNFTERLRNEVYVSIMQVLMCLFVSVCLSLIVGRHHTCAHAQIRCLLPPDAPLTVTRSPDGMLGPWLGARDFAAQEAFGK
jgi:actin-related protein